MARPAENLLPLPDGRRVAASLKQKKWKENDVQVSGEVWHVKFPDPLNPKKYKEATTGKRTENEAWIVAGQIVLDAYTAAGLKPTAKTITWKQVHEELKKSGGKKAVKLEPSTLNMYRYATDALERTVPTKGPSDITPEVARRFAALYESTPYTRSPKEGATKYTRKPKSVDNTIHNLSCLYSALIEKKLASSDPFKDCPRPVLDPIEVDIPSEAEFENFFAWVDSLNWEVMSCFVKVKKVSGNRTKDLCKLRSDQFDPITNTITVSRTQTKTKKTRKFPISAKLSKRLNDIKGKTYLWESYTESIREHTHDPRAATEFTTDRFHYAVRRLFESYADKFPDRARVMPHDLRRRAITLTVKACGSVEAAAEALGLTAATVRKHHLDREKGLGIEALKKQMVGILE
ncbi:MAG: tyrosine-type recombinase/integrase [Planctomycetes bacterium]|nr:tyrosine-type recombinase/integrase [Planctomycetota bacterium]